MVKYQSGDRVSIKTKNGKEEGIILESHEVGVILLKLSSGYNIGIKKEDVKSVRVLEKSEVKVEEGKIKMKGKPRVDLIVTGGTIASSLDVKTGAVKWLTSPNELFKYYPEIFDLVDIKIINPFMKSSENMNSGDWMRIARLVKKSVNDANVKGVIVTHGTDFLHYTSAALSFMLKDLKKPVVLTYSQRSIDRGSSDASLNLLCSARVALSDIGEVVLVGHASSNDDFCYALRGTKVRKMHTSRRDAFRPINVKPLLKVWPDRIERVSDIGQKYNKDFSPISPNPKYNSEGFGDFRKREKGQTKSDIVFEDKVALVKFYPGQDPGILDYYVKEKYKGIVLEMGGLGHVTTEGSKNWVGKLREIIKKGIVVCAVAQTIYGRLDPLVYSPGRELEKLGIIYLEDMLAETALVKLGWILGHKEFTKDNVKEMMLENLRGEFNKRL